MYMHLRKYGRKINCRKLLFWISNRQSFLSIKIMRILYWMILRRASNLMQAPPRPAFWQRIWNQWYESSKNKQSVQKLYQLWLRRILAVHGLRLGVGSGSGEGPVGGPSTLLRGGVTVAYGGGMAAGDGVGGMAFFSRAGASWYLSLGTSEYLGATGASWYLYCGTSGWRIGCAIGWPTPMGTIFCWPPSGCGIGAFRPPKGVCRPPGVPIGVARRERRDAMIAVLSGLRFSSAMSHEQTRHDMSTFNPNCTNHIIKINQAATCNQKQSINGLVSIEIP